MDYGEKYDIDKTSQIMIYGAATTGALLYSIFTKKKYNVIGFIDKRADEIESYYNLPVFNLEQTGALLKKNKEIIIIIGIKNVFEHERIAKQLWEMGCDKIIFRPYDEVNGKGNEKDALLNDIYSNILLGELPGEGYKIEEFTKPIFEDKAIIESTDQYIVANIPAYYVFTDLYKDIDILWGDIPCLGLVPHVGLFKFFLGIDNEDYLEYIKFCSEAASRSGGIKTSKAWEESVYKNRLDVFNHMQYSWEHDRSFFIKNAVEADYNEKGYFNIKSGKHRVVYMLVKGRRFIPLKLKRSDYERWCDVQKAKEVSLLLNKMDIGFLPINLGNPYFYDYPCSTSSFYEQVLIKLIGFIYQMQYHVSQNFDFSSETVLLYNTPMILYANVFRMLGFKVDAVEENVEKHILYNTIAGQAIQGETSGRKHYFLAITEKEITNHESNIEAKARVNITGVRDSKGELFVNGIGESGFLYAFLIRES